MTSTEQQGMNRFSLFTVTFSHKLTVYKEGLIGTLTLQLRVQTSPFSLKYSISSNIKE